MYNPLLNYTILLQNSGMIIPNWLQSSSTRCFGTLRALINPAAWKLENSGSTGFLQRGIPTQEVCDAPEDSITSSSCGGYYVPVRGMKYKGRVKRRCKDCFLMYVNGMLYNLCKTHPRHKAGLKPPYFVNQRILTHAMSTPKRPY